MNNIPQASLQDWKKFCDRITQEGWKKEGQYIQKAEKAYAELSKDAHKPYITFINEKLQTAQSEEELEKVCTTFYAMNVEDIKNFNSIRRILLFAKLLQKFLFNVLKNNRVLLKLSGKRSMGIISLEKSLSKLVRLVMRKRLKRF